MEFYSLFVENTCIYHRGIQYIFMKDNKEKIEFWLHENQKAALKRLSENTGYTISELMRRGAEYVIRELAPPPPIQESNKEELKNV